MKSVSLLRRITMSSNFYRLLFCCLFTTLFHLNGVYAQAPCTKINCTANDVTVVSNYISGPNNAQIDCNLAQPFLNAELHLVVNSNASRIGASISATINSVSNGVTTTYSIGACYSGVTLNIGSNNNLVYPLGTLLQNLHCVATFTLTNVFTAWGAGGGNFCNSTDFQCPDQPSKCNFTAGQVSVLPVKLDIDFTSVAGVCANNGNGLAFIFTPIITETNIIYPLAYHWIFGDGTTFNATQLLSSDPKPTAQHTYAAAGDYTVTLTVTDASSPAVSRTSIHSVTAISCCNVSPPQSGGNQTVCALSPVQKITAAATGGTVTWYDAATGGNLVADPSLSMVGTKTYYAESSVGACKSPSRTAVILTINASPAAPISSGNQTSCETTAAQTLTAMASGGTITWYNSLTGGTIVSSPTLSSVGTVTYYAESSDGTCPSLSRTGVTLTINAAPAAPIGGSDQVACETTAAQTLTATATGGTITWYTSLSGGTAVSPTLSSVGTVTYYAQSMDGNNCSSLSRTGVTLTINAAPVAPNVMVTDNCNGTSTLTASNYTGSLMWSTTQTDASIIVANPGTYTVTQTVNSCVSASGSVMAAPKSTPTATITVGSQKCTNGVATYTLTVSSSLSGSSFTWSKSWDADGTFSTTTGGSTVYTPGMNDNINPAIITVTVSLNECSSSTMERLISAPCTATLLYSYTQGYYHGTGKSCTPFGIKNGGLGLSMFCLDNTDGILGNSIGQLKLGKPGASFTVNYADAANLVAILPGGGTAGKLMGDYDVSLSTISIPLPPLKNGSINNILLSQTIVLGLNMNMPGNGLSSFVLNSGYLTTQKADKGSCPATKMLPCSADVSAISSLQITGNTTLMSLLTGKTVNDLFNMASAALGGTLPSGVSYADISSAVDVFNRSFDGGRFFIGYYSTAQSCDLSTTFRVGEITTLFVAPVISVKELTIHAYPNPFTNKVKFSIVSPVSGKAILELYNLLGQKISTVYEGYLFAGKSESIEYRTSNNNTGSLIYILRVGNQVVNGKLVKVK